jgi:hypothetical protein
LLHEAFWCLRWILLLLFGWKCEQSRVLKISHQLSLFPIYFNIEDHLLAQLHYVSKEERVWGTGDFTYFVFLQLSKIPQKLWPWASPCFILLQRTSQFASKWDFHSYILLAGSRIEGLVLVRISDQSCPFVVFRLSLAVKKQVYSAESSRVWLLPDSFFTQKSDANYSSSFLFGLGWSWLCCSIQCISTATKFPFLTLSVLRSCPAFESLVAVHPSVLSLQIERLFVLVYKLEELWMWRVAKLGNDKPKLWDNTRYGFHTELQARGDKRRHFPRLTQVKVFAFRILLLLLDFWSERGERSSWSFNPWWCNLEWTFHSVS